MGRSTIPWFLAQNLEFLLVDDECIVDNEDTWAEHSSKAYTACKYILLFTFWIYWDSCYIGRWS